MELVKRGAWHEARARARVGLDYGSTANDEDKLQQANLHGILAGVAYELGDVGVAAAERRQAVDLFRAAGRPDLASGLLEG